MTCSSKREYHTFVVLPDLVVKFHSAIIFCSNGGFLKRSVKSYSPMMLSR